MLALQDVDRPLRDDVAIMALRRTPSTHELPDGPQHP